MDLNLEVFSSKSKLADTDFIVSCFLSFSIIMGCNMMNDEKCI